MLSSAIIVKTLGEIKYADAKKYVDKPPRVSYIEM
jgi:hypothetical protein